MKKFRTKENPIPLMSEGAGGVEVSKTLFYYIGNCSAIPYIAKRHYVPLMRYLSDRYMSLTRPHQTSSVP